MIVRVNKTQDYTVMSNYHLKDRNLTLKAKGLLSVILSLPDGWEYSVAGLAAISKEKETSINTALKELKENGYLIITKKMPNETNSGRIEYEWDFYECSCNPCRDSIKPADQKQAPKKQEVENQGLEFQGLENQAQLNTNIENTNIENTDDISIMEKPKNKRFVIPSVDEVQAYCDERGNGIDAQHFIDYYTARGWKLKNTPVKDWKACIRTWEKNSYNKPASRSGGNEFTALYEKMGAGYEQG